MSLIMIYISYRILHCDAIFQNMISSVRLQLTKAMKSNDLEELENLVDLIRAKQLDKEFEKELFYAQVRSQST